MVVTLGQQYNVGEKPTVILYTHISRHAGTSITKTKHKRCSTSLNRVLIIYDNSAAIEPCCCLVVVFTLKNRSDLYPVCVCIFFPFILDIKFVGRTSRGHTGGRSHRISHPPSFCGACLYFFREKD